MHATLLTSNSGDIMKIAYAQLGIAIVAEVIATSALKAA
jgi:hypothetical protein